MGVQGPMGVYEEPNDTRHIGYQFHSFFCTENEYKVVQPLGDHIRRQRGVSWASRVLWGSVKNLMIQGILSMNSTQFSALKINTRSPNLYEFIPDAHGCPMGVQGPMGVYEEPNDTRHIGYQFHCTFYHKGVHKNGCRLFICAEF